LEQFDPGVGGLSKVQAQKALAGRAPRLFTPERQASDKDAYAARGLGFGQCLQICFARASCETERKTASAPNSRMKPRRSSSGALLQASQWWLCPSVHLGGCREP